MKILFNYLRNINSCATSLFVNNYFAPIDKKNNDKIRKFVLTKLELKKIFMCTEFISFELKVSRGSELTKIFKRFQLTDSICAVIIKKIEI